MNGSWRLGRLAGIDIFVHWTFLLLPLLIAFSSLAAGNGVMVALHSVFFLLAVFGCVVLHELGHALAARSFGIQTHDIILLPIGGLARLERMPENPMQELVVALAGPAVNVVLAAAFGLVLFIGFGLTPLQGMSLEGFSVLGDLMLVNIALLVFNLIPAFPMDGGRVLRALLGLFVPYPTATLIAARVGQAFAILGVVLGFYGYWGLILIGLFVFFAADAELRGVRQRKGLYTARVGDAMLRQFPTFQASWTLERAWQEASRDPIQYLPVAAGSQWVGLVPKSLLAQSLVRYGGSPLLGQLVGRKPPAVRPDKPLNETLSLMLSGPYEALPVFSGQRLVGLITIDRIRQLLQPSSEALPIIEAVPVFETNDPASKVQFKTGSVG